MTVLVRNLHMDICDSCIFVHSLVYLLRGFFKNIYFIEPLLPSFLCLPGFWYQFRIIGWDWDGPKSWATKGIEIFLSWQKRATHHNHRWLSRTTSAAVAEARDSHQCSEATTFHRGSGESFTFETGAERRDIGECRRMARPAVASSGESRTLM